MQYPMHLDDRHFGHPSTFNLNSFPGLPIFVKVLIRGGVSHVEMTATVQICIDFGSRFIMIEFGGGSSLILIGCFLHYLLHGPQMSGRPFFYECRHRSSSMDEGVIMVVAGSDGREDRSRRWNHVSPAIR